MKVLFSCAGRRVELINCFRNAARELDLPLTALAADHRPDMSAGCQAADSFFALPRIDDPRFISELLRICEAESVRLLVPTIDTELELLAANQQRFAAIGTQIAISNLEVIGICRNKLKTASFLQSLNIPAPRTASAADARANIANWRFPLILKPVAGSSSVGIIKLSSREVFEKVELGSDSYLAQELWTGDEYTVNLFFDANGLRCIVPHLRCETRAGEVSKGLTLRVPQLTKIARLLGEAWKRAAFGALCFQAIVTASGEAVVFEINGRFGGGYPLADRAGAKFARWLLEIVSGRPSSAHDNWEENLLMLRFDSAFFLQRAPSTCGAS